jgi:hypothetical protein
VQRQVAIASVLARVREDAAVALAKRADAAFAADFQPLDALHANRIEQLSFDEAVKVFALGVLE